ncbi:LTA synthase family protein [Pseudoflavonifractor phocaeensis]|uniref:LTA synthase family protein n=1 Tax=Pseudoflavonifractor phocaeensis TaxID=1870988 RepID=UPI001F457009|nr:LTA synthase family protein [Pseudoflavonifractor phocaeensis]MCF2661078.1 LTA synthase family protein [Pseudoflavonifractor phocaeensis]
MSYNGRRVLGGQEQSGYRGRSNTPARVLFFPALFVYLELVLHLYMKMALQYLPIWLLYGLAAGGVCTALTLPFKRRINGIITKVLAVVVTLVYVVEMIAKKILQSYYPLSTLGTAAGNRLTDYADVILSTVVSSIPIILVFFLPVILLCALGRRFMGYDRFDVRFSGLVLAGALVLHLLGLGVVHLPWNGDLTPKMLYRMDTNIDDQVEQLGLWNMLRLDVKHMAFPVKNDLDADFSGIGDLGASSADPAGSGADSSGDVSEPDPAPVIDTSPNVMDVDLSKLSAETSNKDVKWLADYFNSVTPTKKNEYTGMFEGYNVIQLVLEGFSGYVIDPELTPTLYKLTHEGFIFNNYYTALHFTSTSNGECQTLLGLYPKNGNPITMKRTGVLGTNCYFSLAQQLGRAGYEVLGYHGNYDMYGRLASHTNLGYDWRQYQSGLELEMGETKPLWPQRDSYVIEASVDDYINSDKPFHVYYLTISGHMPYSNNRIVAPYRDTVRALPYSETTQNYIATAMEVDKALEVLLDKLEAAGKLDKTLIVATGDHIPYFNVDTLEELSGQKFGSSEDMEALKESNIDFDVYKNSLILWTASMEEPVVVNKVCCQVDILPTLSNLLGLEYDSRMLDGSDILSDSEGLVVFTSRCWKSDKGFYNRFTGEFTPAEGVDMTAEEQESYVSAMKKLVGYKLDSTPLIIENDFYDLVFGQN